RLLGVLGLRAFVLLGLRLEHPAYARSERSFSSLGGSRVGPPLSLEDLGCGVVRNVVAADLVVVFLEQRPIEQLEQPLLPVVHRALREAFVVLVDAVALLAKTDRVAVRRRRQGIVRVLMEHDAIGTDLHRSLRDDDVAGELAVLAAQVGAAGVALIENRLVAVGFFRLRDRDQQRRGASQRARGSQQRLPMQRTADSRPRAQQRVVIWGTVTHGATSGAA